MDDSSKVVKRIAKDGILLALLCVMGMFSIPFGENIKVSLQLYMVMVICLLADSVFDCLIITGSYLALGMFLPIYAGFASGISPTFGFVIGFVLASPVFYFLNKIKLPAVFRMALACLGGLIVVYAAGSVFMMLYLGWDIGKTLMVSVVPYLPFDAIKIALAILTVLAMPALITKKE
ncbi:MAG: biotin transporter BioY [Bacilli bacterium]|nr:biotin transporter BioY [Bacilli bacterium]